MVDGNAIRTIIADKGLKMGFIADKMKMDRRTLNSRLDNKSDITSNEIVLLSKLLDIPISRRNSIFFVENADEQEAKR